MNFKLLIQYDGTDFHGWQMQDDLRTVQGELTRALSLIDGRSVNVHGSGRTDAGAHAEGQVASVHLNRVIEPSKLRSAINGNVEKDLRVLSAETVSDDFHARFSARSKTYTYRVVNGPVISPFLVRYAHHEGRTLDLGLMQDSADHFLGTHDWTAFSAAQSDAENRVRTLSRVEVSETCDNRGHVRVIEITITGDGFLRYMVRSIVGTMLAIGRGEIESQKIEEALATGDRSLAGPTAPACGLTLVSVTY